MPEPAVTPKAPPRWQLGSLVRSVKDGTVEARVPVSDDGVLQGHMTFTLSAKRDLRVVYEALPGTLPLAGFTAWILAVDEVGG